MQEFRVDELKPHPRNEELFDDITGEKWDEFLESIKARGVIEPLIITQDKVIVSGHQRVRACKELGIETVMCEVRVYNSEDDILQDLLETNMRQRGDIGGSAQKVGKRIKELERLYGVRQGSAGKARPTTVTAVGQEDIAERFGLSVSQLRSYKKLADMIPELSEAVDTGRVTQSSALAIMKQLSEDEQLELLSSLDSARKYTQKETQKYIDEIRTLKSKPPEVIEKTPKDYEINKEELEATREELIQANHELNQKDNKIAELEETVEGQKADYEFIRKDSQKLVSKNRSLEAQLQAIKAEEPEQKAEKKRIDASIMFAGRISKFIEDVGGYVWLTDEVNELPEEERMEYIRSVQKIRDWADQMLFNIKNKMEEIQ